MSSFLASAQARAEVGLRIAFLIERHTKLPQIGAGQIARTLHDELQGGDGVNVVADIGREAVEEVLGLGGVAIAARDATTSSE